jgi:hypothetical protein
MNGAKLVVEAKAIREFEKELQYFYDLGASNRKQAIKWFVQNLEYETNQDLMGDSKYICYLLDLPSSMKKEFEI